jgi:hypothetical protein
VKRAFVQCKISAVRVKFWAGIVLCGVAAAGCSGPPRVVRSSADVRDDEALLVFAVEVNGDSVPVSIGLDREPFLGFGLFREDLVLTSRAVAGAGEYVQGQLVALAVIPEPVRLGVRRVGDYWEFSGGKLQQEIEPKIGMAYYLGTVVIEYAGGESYDVSHGAEEEYMRRTLPRSPADVPPRTRYLLANMRILNEEDRAARFVAQYFGLAKEQFVNRTRHWDRIRSGGILQPRRARPVPVSEP